jgi:hypothetical protein
MTLRFDKDEIAVLDFSNEVDVERVIINEMVSEQIELLPVSRHKDPVFTHAGAPSG